MSECLPIFPDEMTCKMKKYFFSFGLWRFVQHTSG